MKLRFYVKIPYFSNHFFKHFVEPPFHPVDTHIFSCIDIKTVSFEIIPFPVRFRTFFTVFVSITDCMMSEQNIHHKHTKKHQKNPHIQYQYGRCVSHKSGQLYYKIYRVSHQLLRTGAAARNRRRTFLNLLLLFLRLYVRIIGCQVLLQKTIEEVSKPCIGSAILNVHPQYTVDPLQQTASNQQCQNHPYKLFHTSARHCRNRYRRNQ